VNVNTGKMKRLCESALLAAVFLLSIEAIMAGEIGLCDFNDIGAGDVCKINHVEALHPTQFAVGREAAQCKAINQLQAKFDSGHLQKYLEAEKRRIPVILGPGEKKGEARLYITDRHHLSASYLFAKDNIKTRKKQRQFSNNKLVIIVIYDWRFLEAQDFWILMEKMELAWSFDEHGIKKVLSSEHPPSDIRDLKDDPFRTISRWVRTGAGYIKPNNAVNFLEFKWANFLREQCHEKDNKAVCSDLVTCATFGAQKKPTHCKAALEEAMGWVAGNSAKTFMKQKGGCSDSNITTKCGFTGVRVKSIDLDILNNELFCDKDPSEG